MIQSLESNLNLTPQFGDEFSRRFEARLGRPDGLISAVTQGLEKLRQLVLRILEHLPGPFRELVGRGVEVSREETLGLAGFGHEDLGIGDAPEVRGKADFRKGPDQPFGRVKLPGFYAVAVVVLELMVVVVIALSESEDRHQSAVARAALA